MAVDIEVDIATRLSHWYRRHARALPWRSPPGAPPADPYRVWLSEIMLQQTTVASATPYFQRFVSRWPTVEALAGADDADLMAAWAGLGYYARARNLLACARIVSTRFGGSFPNEESELRRLPGIGQYTAAAIAAIAFDRRAVVVDGNVERVVARLFAIQTPMPAAKPELHRLAGTITPDRHPGDHAQAMMDLGATICTPRNPACALCPVNAGCAAFRAGTPDLFPVKPPRKAKPVRHGTAYFVERDGAVLLVRRPDKGLLGGMRALPTSAWTDTPSPLADAPADLAWRLAGPSVQHVFTHFTLHLAVAAARIEKHCDLQLDGEWWPLDRLADAGLPTVFAKAARLYVEENAA